MAKPKQKPAPKLPNFMIPKVAPFEIWQRRFAEIEELPYDFDRWYVSDVSRG